MARLNFTIKDIPPREPNEGPATEKQLDYLRHLARFRESEIQGLGKWQASYLIDRAKALRDEIRFGNIGVKKKKGCGCLSVILLIIILAGLISIGNRDSERPPKAKQENAPKIVPKAEKETPPKTQPEDGTRQDQRPPIPADQAITPKSEFLTTFEGVNLPVTVITTEAFDRLNEEGKETAIPIGSIVNVEKRGEKGTLTTHIKGALFVGSELRLSGKVKPR